MALACGRWDSLISLIKLLSGDAQIAREFLRDVTDRHVQFYFFFFFLFYFNFLLVIIPLILAILRDAYSIRNDQLRELKASMKQQRAQLEKSQEALAKRKRGHV